MRTDIPSPVKLDAQGAFAGADGARRVQNVQVNGQPIDLDATYTVASITYLLRDGGDVFLDNVPRTELEKRLGCPVTPVYTDGEELVKALAGEDLNG